MGNGTTPLIAVGATIEGKYYRVMDFPYQEVEEKGPDILRKGIAYRIDTDITKGLFPYRGIVGRREAINRKTARVGIYMKHLGGDQYAMRIVRPHTKKEQAEYKLGEEYNIAAAIVSGQVSPSDLIDTQIVTSVVSSDDMFKPPVRAQDDPLNTIIKMGIRLKNAPFGPYGKRMEAVAVDKSGIEGTNTKNNNRRGYFKNATMSPTKAQFNADVWGFDLVFLLRDKPGTPYPMFKDGEMLAVFASGPPFEIDPSKIVDARELIRDAIQETNRDELNSTDDVVEDD